ncbi:MAG: type III pantothenate kinase [Ruminococcaceae bacterium]|nr:type III pantothenate kinase [Oscillospiraceae bacterium]
MLLALDVGNSSISVGLFDIINDNDKFHAALRASFKISNKFYSADEYAMLIRDFLKNYNVSTSLDSNLSDSAQSIINHTVISSVVPELTDIVYSAAKKICVSSPFIVGQGIHTGFGIKIKNPEQLGSDIVSNVAAAVEIIKSPFVVLDVGTATTITFVDVNMEIIGSIIIPGLKISMTALTDSAALLSSVPLTFNDELIGKDTQSAIRSGVINGNVYMIDGFIRNIREKFLDKSSDEKLGLIATGGLAQCILPYLRNKFTYNENLTLIGMASLYCRNKLNKR